VKWERLHKAYICMYCMYPRGSHYTTWCVNTKTLSQKHIFIRTHFSWFFLNFLQIIHLLFRSPKFSHHLFALQSEPFFKIILLFYIYDSSSITNISAADSAKYLSIATVYVTSNLISLRQSTARGSLVFGRFSLLVHKFRHSFARISRYFHINCSL